MRRQLGRGPADVRAGEEGQVSLLIIGFTLVLLMVTVVVVNASAAYLQRQGLSTVADGAALQGADIGSTGTYDLGIPDQRLRQTHRQVDAAVAAHLRAVGANDRYPGLRHQVRVDQAVGEVTVTVRAPLELPLKLPGSGWSTQVVATGRAAVVVQR